jgi:hypothetical protein
MVLRGKRGGVGLFGGVEVMGREDENEREAEEVVMIDDGDSKGLVGLCFCDVLSNYYTLVLLCLFWEIGQRIALELFWSLSLFS